MNEQTLLSVIGKTLRQTVTDIKYELAPLRGGTLGDVRLVTGTAVAGNGETLPFKVVWKTQKKWERYGDPNSWRREYDLYASELGETFTGALRRPECYHAEMSEDEIQLWMEYIGGVSGLDLTGDMYERAAEELGRWQGKLYAEQPDFLRDLTNLSDAGAMKNFYLHYRSWNVVYDYIRSGDCEIPRHLCEMIIGADDKADEMWSRIEKLPVVLCHRDFWVANIFCSDGKIVLIDWDTTGWGYLGEDLVSLIADEADVDRMIEYYHKCVPAYRKGFSEYADVPRVTDLYIRERIILHFGYRIVEWFLNAGPGDERTKHLNTLQKVYEMGGN